MYVIREDMKILHEIQGLLDQYEEKFDERFIAFNYVDFKRDGDRCAAQVYKETLEKALKDNKPYHIVSHRYDTIDH